MRGRVRRLAFKVTHAREPRAAILVYHRIAEPGCDPFSLAVSPRRFAAQLDGLRSHYSIVPLRELAAAVAAGRVPHRAVAITFDDGYADNLYGAWPLLAAAAAPATVFVVAGRVGAVEEFWWDRLARWVLHSPKLPTDFSLHIDGAPRLREAIGAKYGPPVDAMDNSWSMRSSHDPSPRHRLFRELWGFLRTLREDVRERAMNDLGSRIEDGLRPRSELRPLSEEELLRLGADGLIEIASHGMTHSRLAELPVDGQRWEVCESRSRLESLLGSPVTTFAYPFGTPDDYTRDTIRLLADGGYTAACMNVSGWIVAGVDRYELPRMRVFDWDGDDLLRRLRSLLWA
jgi:peptidoglycan/xylan/chitin deacetylase (PgdA/CDA1 family)